MAIPLAVQATLAAVSLACHDLIWVDRGIGDISVCSLFMLAVADTGARKSRADDAVTPEIEAYDTERRFEYEKNKPAYEHEQRERLRKIRALEKASASLTQKIHTVPASKAKNADDIAAAAEIALAKVEHKLATLHGEPFKNPQPYLRRVLYSKISIKNLEQNLCINWPSAGPFSDEAAGILNARTESDMSSLDDLWDGKAIDVVGRTARESFSVRDPRLTISLMVQPPVFDRFMERRGELAKGIGFMSRTLISRPDTAYGERKIDSSVERKTEWIDIFNKRIRILFNFGHSNIENRESNRKILRFSRAAARLWENDFNLKEAGTADGGQYLYEREFVNRYSEHVARLAALFHFFEYGRLNTSEEEDKENPGDRQISESTLKSAIQICEWYLGEFSRIFNPDVVMKDMAGHIFQKLTERIKMGNGGSLPEVPAYLNTNIKIRANDLRNYCTKFRLRNDVQKFRSALEWLEDKKLIVIEDEQVGSASKSTKFVRMNYEIISANYYRKPKFPEGS